MENKNSATPAQAAAPEKNEQGQPNPFAGTPPQQGNQGNQQEGQVTISAKEYAELNRNKARLQAFQKRAQFTPKKSASDTSSEEGTDPELVEELRKAREENQKIAADLRIRDIKDKTKELLDNPKFQNIPKIAKDLILKNPVSLSVAESVDEVMIDVEEFIETQMADLKTQPAQQSQNQADRSSQPNPTGHETPLIINAANPAPVNVAAEEDVTNLTGSNKSRAILRNLLKREKMNKGV